MELVSFTFAAGETKRFERAGRYLEIISSAAAVNISLTDADGGVVDYAQGALSGLYMEGAFAAMTVYSATAQTVEFLVTEGRGGSRRQPGIVQVVDTARTLTEQGLAFGSGMGFASAANYSRIELQNPIGSGKRLIVSQIIASVGAASQVQVGWTNAPGVAAASGSVGRKLTIGGVGVAVIVGVDAATALGGVNRLVSVVSLAAGAPFTLALKEPVVILPGNALTITAAAAVSVALNAAADFLELDE